MISLRSPSPRSRRPIAPCASLLKHPHPRAGLARRDLQNSSAHLQTTNKPKFPTLTSKRSNQVQTRQTKAAASASQLSVRATKASCPNSQPRSAPRHLLRLGRKVAAEALRGPNQCCHRYSNQLGKSLRRLRVLEHRSKTTLVASRSRQVYHQRNHSQLV